MGFWRPVRQEMSSKGDQRSRKHRLWENSGRTGILQSVEAKTDERCDNNLQMCNWLLQSGGK